MRLLYVFVFAIALIGCAEKDSENKKANPIAFNEIGWVDLVPEGYSADAIVFKYQEKLDKLEDDDPKAEAIYNQMMAELQDGPLNEKILDKNVKIPGFIAPLTQNKGIITEFLLVPYFGACIHVPPPPVNQTVLVKTATENGIKADEAHLPIWVNGKISLKGENTRIGYAGYKIENASIKPYVND